MNWTVKLFDENEVFYTTTTEADNKSQAIGNGIVKHHMESDECRSRYGVEAVEIE